jgi:hypothetical protein
MAASSGHDDAKVLKDRRGLAAPQINAWRYGGVWLRQLFAPGARGLHHHIRHAGALKGTIRSSWRFLKYESNRLGAPRRPDQKKEVAMPRAFPHFSIIAFGLAAFISSSPLSTVRADTAAQLSPAPSAPAPSLAEPAPAPDFWVESGPDDATVAQHPAARRHARHYARHYAWRDGRRYAYFRDNPVASAATGVAGGVADLGSLAAYPFYCFPKYGSCSVRWPYRF